MDYNKRVNLARVALSRKSRRQCGPFIGRGSTRSSFDRAGAAGYREFGPLRFYWLWPPARRIGATEIRRVERYLQNWSVINGPSAVSHGGPPAEALFAIISDSGELSVRGCMAPRCRPGLVAFVGLATGKHCSQGIAHCLSSGGISRLDEPTQAKERRLAQRSAQWRSPASNHSIRL